MKPGIKTSEFWFSLLAVILDACIATGLVPVDGIITKIVSVIVITLAAYGYTAGRSAVKASK